MDEDVVSGRRGLRELAIGAGPGLGEGRAFHAAGVLQGRVVVAGGSSWNGERTVKRFHEDTLVFEDGSWRVGPKLSQAVVEGAFAQDGDVLFMAGGLMGPDQATDGVFAIGRDEQGWRVDQLAPLPAAVTACSGAVAGGRFYVACGSRGGTLINEVWSLDVSRADSLWRAEPAIPGPGRGYAAMFESGGRIFLLGGLGSVDGVSKAGALDDVYRLDPWAGRWEKAGQLSMKGYCWSAAAIDGDEAIVTGRADGGIHPEIWVLDLKGLAARVAGQSVIQATGAPLVRVKADTWWVIGGEPDSKRSRTELVTAISLKV